MKEALSLQINFYSLYQYPLEIQTRGGILAFVGNGSNQSKNTMENQSTFHPKSLYPEPQACQNQGLLIYFFQKHMILLVYFEQKLHRKLIN